MSARTAAPVAARSHTAQVGRRVQAPRKVAAHRQPRLFEGLVLTARFHAVAFSFGLSVAAAGGWAFGTFVL